VIDEVTPEEKARGRKVLWGERGDNDKKTDAIMSSRQKHPGRAGGVLGKEAATHHLGKGAKTSNLISGLGPGPKGVENLTFN